MSGTTNPVIVEHLRIQGAATDELNTALTRAPLITVTGARAATAYGEHVASQFGADLAEAGATLLTGISYGIEAAAVRGALTAHGRVIVLLPAGSSRVYPSAHQSLVDAVLEAGGMVVSIAPDDAVPSRARFIERSNVLAAITGGVVVVEASIRSSALAVAHGAARAGRPVFAVPGPVTAATSDGPHALIQAGIAKLVTSVDDIQDLALIAGRPLAVRED